MGPRSRRRAVVAAVVSGAATLAGVIIARAVGRLQGQHPSDQTGELGRKRGYAHFDRHYAVAMHLLHQLPGVGPRHGPPPREADGVVPIVRVPIVDG